MLLVSSRWWPLHLIDRLHRLLLDARDLAIGYGGGEPLARVDLQIIGPERVALTGPNGAGKSTLLKTIAGRIAPMGGFLRVEASIAWFDQHVGILDDDATILDNYSRLNPGASAFECRSALARYAFRADAALQRVGTLSGGERLRAGLACVAAGESAPDLLILDEPTNHLDVEARDALIQALNEFAGAVVIISHDPHLLELTADRLLLVADGRVTPFDGDMDDYRKLILGQAREARDEAEAGEPKVDMTAEERREARRTAAAHRKNLAPLRKRAQAAEQLLQRLNAEHRRIADALAKPSIYDGPKDKLAELLRVQGELEKRIAETESDWLEAEAALEEAS